MERNNEKPTNLLRHLWLLRLPGVIAAALYLGAGHFSPLAGHAALLYLLLETGTVFIAVAVLWWLPAEMVAQALPRPRLGLGSVATQVLYLLAGLQLLVIAYLLLAIVLLQKHDRDRSWPPAVTP